MWMLVHSCCFLPKCISLTTTFSLESVFEEQRSRVTHIKRVWKYNLLLELFSPNCNLINHTQESPVVNSMHIFQVHNLLSKTFVDVDFFLLTPGCGFVNRQEKQGTLFLLTLLDIST